METLHIYTRVSSEQQLDEKDEEAGSIGEQRKIGIEIAKKHGMNYEIHNEGAESSKHDNLKNRPVLSNIMKEVKEGKIKNLFVWNINRLARNETAASRIKYDLKEKKVKLFVDDRIYDFEDKQDKFMFGILGVFAEYDNDMRTANFALGMDDAIKEGKMPGIGYYGYKREKTFADEKGKGHMVIDEKEAEVVKLIFGLYLSGLGQTSIANELNKQGFTTKLGCRWAGVKVGEMLHNTVYIGKRNYKKNVYSCPRIITDEDFNKVQAMFRNHTQYKNAKTKYLVMLRGLIKCNRCGHNLNIIKNKNIYSCLTNTQRDRYICCGLKSINADKIENIVWYSVLHTLIHSKALQNKLKKDFENLPKLRPAIEKEIGKYKRQLTELNNKRNTATSLAINGKIDTDYLNKELDKIVDEINYTTKQLDEKIAQLSNLEEGEGKVKELINRLNEMAKLRAITDDEEKRNIILELINHVTIDFDISSKLHYIEIVFKNPNYTTTVTSKGVDINTGNNIVTEMIDENLIFEQEDNSRLYGKIHVHTQQHVFNSSIICLKVIQ